MKPYDLFFKNRSRAKDQEIYEGRSAGRDLDNCVEADPVAITLYNVKMFPLAGDDEWGDMWNVERG